MTATIPRQCPECGLRAPMPIPAPTSRVCVTCGHEWQPEEVTLREIVAPLRELQNEAERAWYEVLAIAHDSRAALGDETANTLLRALGHLAPWDRDAKREAALTEAHAAEVQRLEAQLEFQTKLKSEYRRALVAAEGLEARWAARVKLLEARLARISAAAEGRDEERAS